MAPISKATERRAAAPAAAVAVWWMRVPADPSLAAALLPRLSGEEQAAARAFAFAEDRHAYVAAHALLCHTLDRAAPAGWRLGRLPGGKPVVEAPPGLHVSLTHSRRLVAVAAGGAGPLGVDVEADDRSLSGEAVAELVLAPAERAALRAAADPAAKAALFLGLWTVKEAVVKATGQGLAADLTGFAVALDPPRLLTAGPDGSAAAAWRLFARPLAGHRLAVAVRSAAACRFELHPVEAAALVEPPQGDGLR